MRTLTYDTSAVTVKKTTGTISFTSTTAIEVKTAAGYDVVVNFIPV